MTIRFLFLYLLNKYIKQIAMKILFIICRNLNGTIDARVYVNAVGSYHYLYNLSEGQVKRLENSGYINWGSNLKP